MTNHEPPAELTDKVIEQLSMLLSATVRTGAPDQSPVLVYALPYPIVAGKRLDTWAREIIATCNGIVADDIFLTGLSGKLYRSATYGKTDVLQSAALKLTADEWDAVWTDGKESRTKLTPTAGPDRTYNCRRLAVEHDPHWWHTSDDDHQYYCEGESTRRLGPREDN